MLENMFIGRPPGNYDRLLDFSRAVTGNLFFVPSATFLESAAEDVPAVAAPSAVSTAGTSQWHPSRRGKKMARSVLVPSKEISPMNNLHRELAPISRRGVGTDRRGNNAHP